MLALIVLMFIAIDVIILLVYDIYSATQGTLEAIRLSNRERVREEIGVSNSRFNMTYCILKIISMHAGPGESVRILFLFL